MIAFNEVSLLRQSKQTCSVTIKIKKKIFLKELIGDGVVVSTPIGSTGYNSSLGGPQLNLNSNKFVITPISPFYPRRWKYKVLDQNLTIEIINKKKIGQFH